MNKLIRLTGTALLVLLCVASASAEIEVVPLPPQPAIPAGHLPPPGECRIWLPAQPPGQQPPLGPCAELATEVPLGGWLIHRTTPDAVVVSAYSTGIDNLVGEAAYYETGGPAGPLVHLPSRSDTSSYVRGP